MSIVPNSNHTLHGRLWAESALDSIRIDLTTEGPVSLLGSPTLDLGSLAESDSLDFQVPVHYSTEGPSTLEVTVSVAVSTPPTYRRSFQFFTLVRSSPHRSMTGSDSPLLVEFNAMYADSTDGLITPVQADSIRKVLLQPPATIEVDSTFQEPGKIREQDGSARLGFVTIIGKFVWVDRNNNPHPVLKMLVQLWDAETIGDDRLIAEGFTNETGEVSFTVANDDGLFGGGLDTYLYVRSRNSYIYLHAYKESSYALQTPTVDNIRDNGTYTFNITILKGSDSGVAFGVLTGFSNTALYAESINGNTALPIINVEWPMFTKKRPDGKTREISQFDGTEIYLLHKDRWDWDVMMHEYGHYVQSRFELENNPGGSHSKPCLSVERASKDLGVRMAWGEGWATYFGIVGQIVRNLAAQAIPNVGDVSYDDTEDSKLTVSLEAQDNTYVGEDSEFAVARLFWDLHDAAADGSDNIAIGHQALFNRVKADKSKTLSKAWIAVRAGAANTTEDLGIGGVATNHKVGPTLNGPADNAEIGPGVEFKWTRGVGCSQDLGNSFDMVFYKPGAPPTRLPAIATMQGLGAPNHTMTAEEFQALFRQSDRDDKLLWAVEAKNTAAPATGPYMSVHRTIKLVPPKKKEEVVVAPARSEVGRLVLRPNPSKGRTSFGLILPREAQASVRILDVAGRVVRVVLPECLAAGRLDLEWDGCDGSGRPVVSGVYLLDARSEGFRRVARLVIVR